MFRFEWTDGVNDDLDALESSDIDAAVQVSVFYDFCAGVDGKSPNELMVDALTRQAFNRLQPPSFDLVPVTEALRRGYDICRIKLFNDRGSVLPIRLVFAVDRRPESARIVFLGLMPREDDYDMAGDFWCRVFEEYDYFAIPRCGSH